MFTVHTRTPPMGNLPQAIIDFVGLLKDKEWFNALLDSAEAITEANRLTDIEAGKLKEAQAVIDEADRKQALLKDTLKRIKDDQDVLKADQADITRREIFNDNRNTSLSAREAAANTKEKEATVLATQASATLKQVADAQTRNEAEKTRLQAWADELAEEQANWASASALVAKKKIKG